MLPYQMIAGGRFSISVTGGVTSSVNVECISQNPPDFIIARAITGWGEANDAQSIEWWWEKSMSQGTAKGMLQSSAAATAPALTSAFVSANGISTFDTANPPVYAGLATTAITGNAGTFIVTMANTGSIQVGDYVRLTGTTGELQIGGYTFQVTAVTANTSITLGYMASSGMTFAADATAGTVVKYIPNKMYPRWNYIANITKATQAVVSFTAKNDFTPGEIVSFRVPSEFGMDEINNRAVRVLSVTNSATVSSITLDLDTSGYTTFAFPTSAIAAAGVSPAVCVPSSSGVVPVGTGTSPNVDSSAQQPPGTNLRDSFDNRNTRIIQFGPGLFDITNFGGTDGDAWMWQAFKYDDYKTSTVEL